jgi:hypothetical protein
VPHPNRRAVLAGAAATAAVAATATWSTAMSAPKRQPVIYLPHGGGPWPWMQGHPLTSGTESLRAYLEALPRSMPEAPRAILAVTAHWEATVPTVSSGARPGMYYDYSGFPAHTYEIVWPAPGHPGLATRTRELLAAGGFSTAEDPNRGYDHGTFVPLAVAWPGAEVPTVQLSLVRGLDPETHLRMGRALAPPARRGGADRRQRHELPQHARLRTPGSGRRLRRVRRLDRRDHLLPTRRPRGAPAPVVRGARRPRLPPPARSTSYPSWSSRAPPETTSAPCRSATASSERPSAPPTSADAAGATGRDAVG